MGILAISAGQNEFKKEEDAIRNQIYYLNYGILGLATILKHLGGIDITVFQGNHLTVEELFDVIQNAGIDLERDCDCILLSISSYYSVSWCIEFCKTVKLRYGKRIIVGGRWVVDNHVEWIKGKLRFVDDIIEGFGEKTLAKMFNIPNWDKTYDGSIRCFDWLDYTILHDYKKYQPCIEVSRGCGYGCQFCADGKNKRIPNKKINIISSELDNIENLYDNTSIYFEAPHFIFTPEWTDELCYKLSRRKRTIQWRCTTRVETVPLDKLAMLRKSGLKVLDIGLESASKQQLINMKKTLTPEKYLEKAKRILEECNKNDIWVKFNLLLYAGETYETIKETIDWLKSQDGLIKDVSVSNLVYYYNMNDISYLLNLGASIPNDEDISDVGFINLDLSPEIDYLTAKRYSIEIPKMIVTAKDFYDIKKISYFKNGYTYSDFLLDIDRCDISKLPFSLKTEL